MKRPHLPHLRFCDSWQLRRRDWPRGQRSKVYLTAPQAQTDGKIVVFNKGNFQNDDSRTMLHEIFHQGGFNHQQIVNAIVDLEGVNANAFARWEERSGASKSDKNFGGPYSDFFNAWIGKYCGDSAGNWDLMMKGVLQ